MEYLQKMQILTYNGNIPFAYHLNSLGEHKKGRLQSKYDQITVEYVFYWLWLPWLSTDFC